MSDLVTVKELLNRVMNEKGMWKSGGIGGQDAFAGMPPALRLIHEALELLDKATPCGEAVLKVNVWNDEWSAENPCFNIEWLSYPTDWKLGIYNLYTTPQVADTDTIALNASREIMKIMRNYCGLLDVIKFRQMQAKIQVAIIEAMKG